MLKNKSNTINQKIHSLSIFDKLNIIISLGFFFTAISLPIADINPLTIDAQIESIRLISFSFLKTSLITILLLAINFGMSINSNFKSFFLRYTGISNDIYARIIQKVTLFIILLFFAELVLYFRSNLTQTLNLSLGYYILSIIIIIGLIIDFLFIQRNYKTTKAQENSKVTISRETTNATSNGQSFKNLFDE